MQFSPEAARSLAVATRGLQSQAACGTDGALKTNAEQAPSHRKQSLLPGAELPGPAPPPTRCCSTRGHQHSSLGQRLGTPRQGRGP